MEFNERERAGKAQSLFKLDLGKAGSKTPGAVKGIILLDISKIKSRALVSPTLGISQDSGNQEGTSNK